MTGILLLLLRSKTALAGAGALCLLLATNTAVYLHARHAAGMECRMSAALADNHERKIHDLIENDVMRRSDADLDRRLLKWMRD